MHHVPLHNHSEYSALDGLSTVKEIAQRCVEIGCPACGLTDHQTVAGHLDFAKTLTEYGVKPIFGCEFYHGVKTKFAPHERDQAHFVVGALTNEGLRNLWRLADAASRSENFRFVSRVNWDLIEQYSEGLFATSSCIQGLVPQGVLRDDYTALNRYVEIFKDNFFIELHTYPTEDQHRLNEHLAQIAKERGIPVVYANDAHFASPDDFWAHDLYMKMKTLQHPFALYIQDEADIRKNLSYLPESIVNEALENTGVIAQRVDAQIPQTRRHLPLFVPKSCPWLDREGKKKEANKLLKDLVNEGLKNRYSADDGTARQRADAELKVFLKGGLEHYLLQTWDFCKFCDEEGIPRGPGRGSSAGSIVAFALGITDIDPLKYGLIFERFYNAGREKGFPDIDNDFPKAARKKIRKYLEKRWGPRRVRPIGTVIRLKPKIACDKTYNVCGVTFGECLEVKKILSTVPDIEIHGTDQIGWSRETDPGKNIYVMDHVGDKIARWINEQPTDRHDILWNWIEFCDFICARASGVGVHPSGIVISDVDLDAELPCFWSNPQEVQATMFPMDKVDERMFVKQDILGLRTLDTLQDWMTQIKARGIEFDWGELKDEEDNKEMWSLIHEGHTMGIFQIEDKTFVRDMCRRFKPETIEDLAIILALNRPGPIRSGAPDSFIRRRAGLEEVAYDHPILEPILKDTYGWFLYQEQVIAYFNALGYSLSESDAVRKILGKKKPEDLDDLYFGGGQWKDRGYKRLASEAIGEKAADIIWKKLKEFANYSFNKSHAVAYATIAYRTLFAKYNAPIQFIMACIRTNPEEAGAYVREGNRMGIKILPPDVLRSKIDVDIVNGEILFGISNVKWIGKSSAKYLEQLREIYDISTPDNLLEALRIESEKWETQKVGRSPKQRFRTHLVTALQDAGAFDAYIKRDIPITKKQELEKELLGVIITDHSQQILERNLDELQSCDKFADINGNGTYVLPGIVSGVKETTTRKSGLKMGIITIEYEADTIEFAVFPKPWKSYKFMWKERQPGIFKLKKTEKGYSFEEGKILS